MGLRRVSRADRAGGCWIRASRADVELATGDFERLDIIDAAMRGVETVLLVSPAVRAQEIAVIDSAVRRGGRHIVEITGNVSADSLGDRRRCQGADRGTPGSRWPDPTWSPTPTRSCLTRSGTLSGTAGPVPLSTGDDPAGVFPKRSRPSRLGHSAWSPRETRCGCRTTWNQSPAVQHVACALTAGHVAAFT